MDLPTRLEPVLAGLGYELVLLERAGRGQLRLFIDKPGGITIDDCVAVSNHLTHLFTVENIDYDRLEVSSPGLDRRKYRLRQVGSLLARTRPAAGQAAGLCPLCRRTGHAQAAGAAE